MEVRMTDKQRVLNVVQGAGTELTTAAIRKRAGDYTTIPQPSVRRILNELRAEGLVTRGETHGTWVSTASQPVVEPVISLDSDTVIFDTDGEDVDPLDINAREVQGEVEIGPEGEANLDEQVDTEIQ